MKYNTIDSHRNIIILIKYCGVSILANEDQQTGESSV